MLADSKQYILLPTAKSCAFAHWQPVSLGEFTLHSNLETTVVQKDETKLVLLGYAIHIEHTDWNEQQILAHCPEDQAELEEYIKDLAGNFLILSHHPNSFLAYADAAAVLKLYYLKDDNGILAAASDPKVLLAHFDVTLLKDEKALEYFNSEAFAKHPVYLGDKTRFENIKQLLPNHFMNFRSGEALRYFPTEPFSLKDVDEVALELKSILKRIVKAYKLRFSLKIGLTAGWDSRMVLAATKEVDVSTYTFQRKGMKETATDIKIARKLAQKFNIKHSLLPLFKDERKSVQADLLDAFDLIEKQRVKRLAAGFTQFNERDLTLVGTVSEICKNYYDSVPITDGRSLAQASHYPLMDYVVEHFEEKFQELKEVSEKTGYDLRDLAHWEQDISNFAAQSTFQTMQVVNTLSPFNCRRLIELCLRVDRQFRDKQRHELYKRYMLQAWPELLSIPVNPSLKRKLIVLGKNLGLYPIYKRLSTLSRK